MLFRSAHLAAAGSDPAALIREHAERISYVHLKGFQRQPFAFTPIDRGDVPGPRMRAVGAYVTTPGGGGEVTGFSPEVRIPDDMRAGVASGPAEVRQKVNSLFQHGADSIKLIATGAVLALGTEVGQQELSEEEMRAAVDVAQQQIGRAHV